MMRLLCLALTLLIVTGCTYNRQTGRFESVPPMGSNTVDGVRESVEYLQSRPVAVPSEPPAPREPAERGQVPDGMENPVYVDGHYVWRRGGWVWFSGGWVDQPADKSIYVAPSLTVRDGQRYWRAAHWE